MRSADPDAALIRACVELEVVFARFVKNCEVVDSSGCNPETPSNAETAWFQARETLSKWRSMLQEVNRLVFKTRAGAAAKARLLSQFIDHGLCSDEDVMVLISGLTIDFDKLPEDGVDRTFQNHSTPLPAKRRKRIER